MAASSFSSFDSDPGAKAENQRLPARIGKYEVEQEVGCGDLVRVFLAFDRDIHRPLQLKLLTDLTDTAITQRFRREVADIAKLRVTGMVAIYELGEHVGLPFAATQVPAGIELRQILENNRLSLLEKMQIMWQIGEALQAAHSGGLSWVGLRPSGIAVDEQNHAVIHDFGVVRLTPDESAGRDASNWPWESSGEADALSDIFSFGEIYHRLLQGTDAPAELMELVERCREKRRELRYQSLDEVQEEAEPILRDLKYDRASELLAEARKLVDAHETEAASGLLREILQLDPENREAKKLRSEIRGMTRRETVRPRVSALLQEAGEHATARRFGRALATLEGALQLDATDAEVRSRIEEMRALAEQEQRAGQLAADARELFAQRRLKEAYAKASQALEADSASPDIADLVRSIGEALDRRRKETRIEEGIAKAKSLLLSEAFDGAISILLSLRAEAPDSPLVEQWLDHVRKQAAENRKRAVLEEKLRKVQSMLAQERYNSAILTLGDLATEFPGERQVTDLLDQACVAKDRAAAVQEATVECEQLQRSQHFDRAIELLDRVLAKYPGEPALTALRQSIDEQWRKRKSVVGVVKALEESRWLMEKDRPDLAVESLRNAAMEFPDQPDLQNRLQEIENLLPDWENRRYVRDTLKRVGALEELEQWPVALTVLEEALASCPSSTELLDAALRLRSQMQDQDRRKKLTRRLDLIAQKIEARAWSHALLLIESAESEFPGSPELQARRQQVREGSRRSDAEVIVATVRQFLAEGETARAEEALLKGLETFGDDPDLLALCNEIEEDKKNQEEWHTAQVFFGRRQFDEAEKILVRLATHNHHDALVLLDKVREARAATEEDSFYKRGREKALKLIQQEQYEQAADLLRNLLTLFPGDAILERDLQTATDQSEAPESTPPEPERSKAAPAPPMAAPEASKAAPAPLVAAGPKPSVKPVPAPAAPEPVKPATPKPNPSASSSAGPAATAPAPAKEPAPAAPTPEAAAPPIVARTAPAPEAAAPPVIVKSQPAPVQAAVATPGITSLFAAVPAAAPTADDPLPAGQSKRARFGLRELELELTLDLPAAEVLRRSAIPAAALLLLASGGLVLWKSSRHAPPASAKTTQSAPIVQRQNPEQSSADRITPAPSKAAPANVSRPSGTPAGPSKSKEKPAEKTKARASSTGEAHRAFDPASLAPKSEPRVVITAAALPPPTAVTMGAVPSTLPGPVLGNPTAPPPPAPAPAAAAPAPVMGGKIEAAKLLSSSTPSMPLMARQLGIHGTVTLELTIDPQGTVKGVKVLNGHQMLASAATDAVRKWRYQPARLNGQSIESKIDVKMVFEEKGK
jgi:TonB family protein